MIFWYALRAMLTPKGLFNLSTLLSVLSLSIGVATLVTVMSLVRGYERALESSVFDVIGHIQLSTPPFPIYDPLREIEKLKEDLSIKDFKASAYVSKEALIVKNGLLQGIHLEGLDAQTYFEVSHVGRRKVSGIFDLERAYEVQGVYLGQGVAQSLNVEVGDRVNILVPFTDIKNGIRRRVQAYEVLGTLDLGKYEYNNRYVLMEARRARELLEYTDQAASGLRLRFSTPEKALEFQDEIIEKGLPFKTQSWKDVNLSLFEAIKIEKVIIFLILCIMLVIGAFNLSTSLFLSVYKKSSDISILRTLGLTSQKIARIFIIQGLSIGLGGFILGLALGLFMIQILNKVISSQIFLPPEVYKLNTLQLQPHSSDMILILGASLLICFVATLIPSYRQSHSPLAEGLAHE